MGIPFISILTHMSNCYYGRTFLNILFPYVFTTFSVWFTKLLSTNLPNPRFALGFGRTQSSKWDSDSDPAESEVSDLVDHFKFFEFYLIICQKLNEM